MGEFWEKITGSIGTGNGAGGSGPPKWFRRDNLLILVLLGVLLFIIALPVKKEEPQAASVGTETAEQYNAGIFTSPSQTTGEQETAVDTETRAVAAGSAEEYTAYLEGKLKKMLESVRGLGGVEVMITLESSEERIVEKDMTADRSQTEEQDSAGGTRTVSSSNTGYQTVYQDGSQGTPFVANRHFSVWKPTKSRCWKNESQETYPHRRVHTIEYKIKKADTGLWKRGTQ